MQELKTTMMPHATAVFTTPAPLGAWAEGGCEGKCKGWLAYRRTTQDPTFPATLPDRFLERSNME